MAAGKHDCRDPTVALQMLLLLCRYNITLPHIDIELCARHFLALASQLCSKQNGKQFLKLGKAAPTRAVWARGTAGGTPRFELCAGGEAKGVDCEVEALAPALHATQPIAWLCRLPGDND